MEIPNQDTLGTYSPELVIFENYPIYFLRMTYEYLMWLSQEWIVPNLDERVSSDTEK